MAIKKKLKEIEEKNTKLEVKTAYLRFVRINWRFELIDYLTIQQ